MNQPDLLITHGPSCLDGFGAAWAVQQRWPGTPVVFAGYDDEPPEVEGLGVLIADFSYPEAVMRDLAEKAKWIHIADHHKTAEPIIKSLIEDNVIKGTFDNDRSGAVLAWHYAQGDGRPIPWMLQYIQDRDLWKFEIEGSREVHAVLASIPRDYEAWTALAKRIEDPAKRPHVIAEGAGILRARNADIAAAIAATARTMNIAGHEVPVANVPYMWASEVGHILGEGVPFAATYFDRGDGLRSFSLRSSPEGADVSKIAEKFGGGGHQHAAGFSVPIPADAPVKGKANV